MFWDREGYISLSKHATNVFDAKKDIAADLIAKLLKNGKENS